MNELAVEVMQEPLLQGAEGLKGHMALVLRVMQEHVATSTHRSQFVSAPVLCRRRADEMEKMYAVGGSDDGGTIPSAASSAPTR